MNHSIGVVIVNWNGSVKTQNCIALLREKTVINLEIVVVDNGSMESQVKILKRIKDVSTIFNKDNLGYSCAMNRGILNLMHKKNVDSILLINNDISFIDDFLSPMYELLSQNSKVGSIDPIIHYENKHNEFWYTGGRLDYSTGEINNRYVDTSKTKLPKKPYKVDWNTGCCCLIRKEVLAKIGLLNEEMWMYVEDVDLSLRIEQCGYMNYVQPLSRLYHEATSATGEDRNRNVRYLITRNIILLMKKHRHLFPILIFLRFVFTQFRQGTGLPTGFNPSHSIATIKGIYDGLRYSLS